VYYIPFFIFLLNGSFHHAMTVDKPMSNELCLHEVSQAIGSAKNLPDGGKIIGGCIPLPKDTTLEPKDPVLAPNEKSAKNNEV
jgi:hypothetical protein